MTPTLYKFAVGLLLAGLILCPPSAFTQPAGSTGSHLAQAAPSPMNPEKRQLLDRLNQARAANDIALMTKVEAELDRMNGTVTVPLLHGAGIPVIQAAPPAGPAGLQSSVSTSQITGAPGWSIATATTPGTGRLLVARTRFAGGGGKSDTLQVFYSDNGGQNWTYYNGFFFGGSVVFGAGELDLEVVKDTANVWLFGVAGATNAGTGAKFCEIFRYNTTTPSFFAATLQWPGYANASNSYYNPRITSDNARWTSTPYVYVIASSDSVMTDTTDYVTQKYAVLMSPTAAAPTISYHQPNPSGNGFWFSSNVRTGTYLYGDIGYYNTVSTDTADRVMVVFNLTTFSALFLAWTDDYGGSIKSTLLMFDTGPVKGARIAFNGGYNVRSGMLVYLRQKSATDWDTRFQNTSTGGTSAGAWNSGAIDSSTDKSTTCDLIAVRQGFNLFKAAYSMSDSLMYAGFDGNVWNSPRPTKVNTIKPDTVFGAIRAGYKLGGGDDGLAVWAGVAGMAVYATRTFGLPVSVDGTPPGAPLAFHLEQNYPNPFNPSTTINYTVGHAGKVTLTIFNLLGQEIATIVDGEVVAGRHEARWNAAGAASGVYFYRLNAGGYTSTRKLIVLK